MYRCTKCEFIGDFWIDFFDDEVDNEEDDIIIIKCPKCGNNEIERIDERIV